MFLSQHLYFATGHRNVFSALHPAAAFVGLQHFEFYTSGALLALNTFSSVLLIASILPHIAAQFKDQVAMQFLYMLLLRHACTTVNALVNRHHLMLWETFAPKYTFDSCMLIVTGIVLVAMKGMTWHQPSSFVSKPAARRA